MTQIKKLSAIAALNVTIDTLFNEDIKTEEFNVLSRVLNEEVGKETSKFEVLNQKWEENNGHACKIVHPEIDGANRCECICNGKGKICECENACMVFMLMEDKMKKWGAFRWEFNAEDKIHELIFGKTKKRNYHTDEYKNKASYTTY